MRLHRRALHPEELGPSAWDCYEHGSCPPPPPVPSSPGFGPGPGPSPSPSTTPRIPPCSPFPWLAPSPTPAPHGGSGRRDQGGTHGYGPPPPGVGGAGDDNRWHFVKYALVAAGVIAFVSLILLGVSIAVRRRQVRRRRQALLAQAAPAGAGNAGDGGNDPEDGGGGGGGVVHHIWYIRTVGLDEAAINSIAVTQYRAGAGLLGAADCSVCLGEFQDGELVRLLPKCGHAFHVPCIDTWLRAHVNCPLCRSDVLDPAVTAGAGDGGGGGETTVSSNAPADPADVNANVEAEQAAAASDAIPDPEQEESDHQEEEASPAQEDQDEQSTMPEPPPPPSRMFCALPRNVRRASSMDAAIVSTAADVAALERLPEAAPEEEQIGGRRKRSCVKASGSGHRSNLSTDRPASVGVPRSFFSRHSRARSSVLPL